MQINQDFYYNITLFSDNYDNMISIMKYMII